MRFCVRLSAHIGANESLITVKEVTIIKVMTPNRDHYFNSHRTPDAYCKEVSHATA